jgi:isoleucyl-tRNA synthetase
LKDEKNNFDLNSKEIKKWPELERFILHKIFLLNKKFENCFKEYNFHKLYKELANFCSLDLSAFYFDIRKDTLYCDDLLSTKRKACINLLGLILDIFLKWFAPILSFTTEEIFQIINKGQNSSIHLQIFPKIPTDWNDEKLFKKWEKFMIIKKVVNAAIEEKRSNKDIGSSLEADVEIYLKDDYLEIVKDFDLSENFITSKAVAKKLIKNNNSFFKLDEIENINVFVKKAEGEKCPRCWKIFTGPCARCEANR